MKITVRAELYILCKFDCTILRNIAINIQWARERLYLNSKHLVDHYRDIHLYTYRPRRYHFTGACLCLRPWIMAVTRGIKLPQCYKKLKNDNFTKILDATTKEFEFCKFSFSWRFSV